MFEVGKLVFGVVSLIMMYNILNIRLPPFLETIKNNEDIIKVFSFYYVYDLTGNAYISFLSVLLIELSRKYHNEMVDTIKQGKDNIFKNNDDLKKKIFFLF